MKNFKKGDTVVMFDSIEARNPKNYGKIWVCACDSYIKDESTAEVVFLEGLDCSYHCRFLQLVIMPPIAEDKTNLKNGTKPIKEISGVELLGLALKIGVGNNGLLFHEPVIGGIDNTTFSDKVVIDFVCRRKDGFVFNMAFFLNHEKMNYHYTSNGKQSDHVQNLNIDSLSYLMRLGYYINFDNPVDSLHNINSLKSTQ